jgi:hypothetical protein
MIANIPSDQSAINFFINAILIFKSCFQIFEILRTFKGVVNHFYVVIFPEFCPHDMKVCLVFSARTSRAISLLATNIA